MSTHLSPSTASNRITKTEYVLTMGLALQRHMYYLGPSPSAVAPLGIFSIYIDRDGGSSDSNTNSNVDNNNNRRNVDND